MALETLMTSLSQFVRSAHAGNEAGGGECLHASHLEWRIAITTLILLWVFFPVDSGGLVCLNSGTVGQSAIFRLRGHQSRAWSFSVGSFMPFR